VQGVGCTETGSESDSDSVAFSARESAVPRSWSGFQLVRREFS